MEQEALKLCSRFKWDAYDIPYTQNKHHSVDIAAEIYQYSVESVKSFYEIFEILRKSRGKKGGGTTHSEQDLLRGMIVFAAAGLDSTLKQLVRDNLRNLCSVDDKVKDQFDTFVERKLKDSDTGINIKMIKEALMSTNTKNYLVEEYLKELTKGSLQSAEEIIKTSNAIGINLSLDRKIMKDIFEARNQIIHDLDYNIKKTKKKQRNRRQRSIDDIVKWVDQILKTGSILIKETIKRLDSQPNII